MSIERREGEDMTEFTIRRIRHEILEQAVAAVSALDILPSPSGIKVISKMDAVRVIRKLNL